LVGQWKALTPFSPMHVSLKEGWSIFMRTTGIMNEECSISKGSLMCEILIRGRLILIRDG